MKALHRLKVISSSEVSNRPIEVMSSKQKSQFLADANKILPDYSNVKSKYMWVLDYATKQKVLGFNPFTLPSNISNKNIEEFEKYGKHLKDIFDVEFYDILEEAKQLYESFTYNIDKRYRFYAGILISYRTFPMYFELKYKNIKKYEDVYGLEYDADYRKDMIMKAFKQGDIWYEPNATFDKVIKAVNKRLKDILSDSYWSKVLNEIVKDYNKYERKFRRIDKERVKRMMKNRNSF